MVEHFSSVGSNRVERVFLSASVKSLDGDKASSRGRDGAITLGYVGALSEDTWHKPKYLLELYLKFRSEFKKTRIIIATTSNHDAVKHVFSRIPQSELVLTSTKTVEELSDLLKNFHFSALSYFVPKNEMEKTLSEVVLAVKTAEYLSAGIPVLVNRYCGGAASIIRDNFVGISYDPGTHSEISRSNMVKLLDNDVSNRAKYISEDFFDYSSNAKRYGNIYEELAGLG